VAASAPRARRHGAALASAVLCAGALGLIVLPAASAAWEPGATPASAAGVLLGDDRSAGALLSGDGRYVVFQTAASVLLGDPPDEQQRYALGIVRKDLVTGDVDLVAPPQRVLREDGTPQGSGTDGLPSGISHDGRYVLFGTKARLSAADGASASPDVYLRDMTRPVSVLSSYELVSAQDGAGTGADYADPSVGSEPGAPGYALSSDGRRAVFVSRGVSNLPAGVAPATPAQQVWVRDLDARTTRLISRAKTDPSTAGTPAPHPAPNPGRGIQAPNVAISANGTKVVWTAGDAERQTRTLPGEGPIGSSPTLLWRDLDRITAPARRVAGAADPDDPACDPATYAPSNTATGPCYGPFVTSEGVDQRFVGDNPGPSSLAIQGISGDGERVLFLSAAYRRPVDVLAFRSGTAYLADMRAGVPRRTGVTVAWANPSVDGRAPAVNGRLAADGRHATFVSRDNRFDGLQGVGSFPTGSLLPFNVFAVDLDARTVELVTRAPDGGDYATESQAPSTSSVAVPSADGQAVAFPAPDGNLFVGDANGVDDVLVARVVQQTGTEVGRERPAPPVLPAPPVDMTAPRALPSRYFVTVGRVAVSKRTGTATLVVGLPTGGKLTATARGTATRRVRGRKRSATVTVGRTSRSLKRPGTVTVKVKVGAKARAALRRSPHRLAVRLAVTFRPKGAAPTSATRKYTLRRADVTAAAPKKQRKTTKASAAARRTR
jgi:hypothetical protein